MSVETHWVLVYLAISVRCCRHGEPEHCQTVAILGVWGGETSILPLFQKFLAQSTMPAERIKSSIAITKALTRSTLREEVFILSVIWEYSSSWPNRHDGKNKSHDGKSHMMVRRSHTEVSQEAAVGQKVGLTTNLKPPIPQDLLPSVRPHRPKVPQTSFLSSLTWEAPTVQYTGLRDIPTSPEELPFSESSAAMMYFFF